MGTWDEGVLDNDGALDTVDQLLEECRDGAAGAPLIVATGLNIWFGEFYREEDLESQTRKILTEIEEFNVSMPSNVLELLQQPERIQEKPTRRSAKLSKAIGSYCNGPFVEEFIAFEGGDISIDTLIESCASMVEQIGEDDDLYEAADYLGAIGLLAAIHEEIRKVSAPIEDWRRTLQIVNDNTTDEREFWNSYFINVCALLDIMNS